jgi:hypothetical protein
MSNPWFKFYPTDWKADDRLRMCSVSARGLWIEMICIMHHADPYGHLVVNGEAPTDTQLAVLTGIPTDQLAPLASELEKAGVFSRTQKGVIYSRRLVRDHKKSKINQKNGKNGGAPKHKKNKGNSGVGKPPLQGGDKPHIPEARSQNNTSYWFEGEIVRVNQADYERWRAITAFDEKQMDQYLESRDNWLQDRPTAEQSNWYISTQKDLEKRFRRTA